MNSNALTTGARPGRRIVLALLACVLAAHAAWVLFSALRADNPGDLDASAGLVFDGPSKCHNARTRVLFGQWRTDEWTPYLHSPLHTVLMAGVFKVLGVGFVQMRLPGAVAMFFSLGLLFFILHPLDRRAAWLAAILAAVNHVLLMYGRSGLLEPLLVFFELLAVWALAHGYRADLDPKGTRRAGLWFALAALATVAAYLSKATAWPFMLVVAAWVTIRPPARKGHIVIFWMILAAAAAAYLGLFLPANREFMARETSHWFSRAAGEDLWFTWCKQAFFADMRHANGLMMMAFLALPLCLQWPRAAGERARAAPLILLALTLLIGSQFLAVVEYRPLRYYLPLIPCVIALAAVGLVRLADWGLQPAPPARLGGGRLLLAWATGTYVGMFGVLQPIMGARPSEARWPHGWRLAVSGLVALGLITLWRWGENRIRRGWSACPLRWRQGILGLALGAPLAAYVYVNVAENQHWLHRTETAMADFSRMLGRDYRGSCFSGHSPTFLVMENRHRSLKVTPYGTNHRLLRPDRVTHLLLAAGRRGLAELRSAHSHMMPQAPAVERLEVSGFVYDLYPVTLRPLEAGPLRGDAATGWTLEVRNPDAHTPQSVCLAAVAEREGQRLGLGADEHRILPLSAATFRVPAPPRAADRVEFWLLPRFAWMLEPWEADGRNVRRKHDAMAWDMRAWRLKRSSRAVPSEESFLSTAVTGGVPALIGVRLRGRGEPGDEIRLEEKRNGQVVGSHAIPVAGVQSNAYFTFVAPAAGKPDRLQLVWRGRSELYVNGFLALAAGDLERLAVWRGAWPATSP